MASHLHSFYNELFLKNKYLLFLYGDVSFLKRDVSCNKLFLIEINYTTLTIFELCTATYLKEDNREISSSSILKNFLKLLISITDMIITR